MQNRNKLLFQNYVDAEYLGVERERRMSRVEVFGGSRSNGHIHLVTRLYFISLLTISCLYIFIYIYIYIYIYYTIQSTF
jgi:hypothetical protein